MKPERDLARLEERLGAVAAVLDWPDERLYLRVDSVSAWRPAQHVDHVLRSLDLMLERVGTLEVGSAPEIQQAGRPSLLGRVLLATGWIPRGRGEAPSSVLPDPRPVRHRLRESLAAAVRRTRDLRGRARDLGRVTGCLAHPLLGAFDARSWLRFADVHTKHHLAIVADVDRHRAVGTPAAATRPADPPEYEVGPETP